jgi:anhydro-N-acetylmuramic acid kinase
MRIIGLISGTSVDGIDAALVEVTGSTYDLAVDLITAATYPYPESLRSQILAVCHGERLSMAEMAALDDAIATTFAQAALSVQAEHPTADLIGSHGQTVYHRPPQKHGSSTMNNVAGMAPSPFPLLPFSLGYSLQLGRGELIAQLTGIPTVSNFRAADIAVGGQGAPLVPPIDVYLLSHPVYNRCVQNIGGIGNVAYLPAIRTPNAKLQAAPLPILGWDTGPGNALLDQAVQQLSGGHKSFDEHGAWAAQGTPCQPLVQQWLQQDFFQQPPPKSTGRELFGAEYLDLCLQDAAEYQLDAADILATLTEFTAASIVHSYRLFLPQMPDQVLLCGGGSRNLYLKQRIQANLDSVWVGTTDEVGLSAEYKEAIAFAVLAYWRTRNIPGNLPEVTGAQQAVLLGEIHLVA